MFASDAYLSPEHAEFRFEDDQLVVKDMESLNGVYIRIDPEVPIELFDGTVFRIGQEILRFEGSPSGCCSPATRTRPGPTRRWTALSMRAALTTAS